MFLLLQVVLMQTKYIGTVSYLDKFIFMKVHHLSCGSMCPFAGKLLPGIFPQEAGCHVLLVEAGNGLVLVDTGLGQRDFDELKRLRIMRHLLGVNGSAEQAAINQIRKLGFSPEDVHHIIPTHLDLDHAGGIVDFPSAKIHTLQRELSAVRSQSKIKKSVAHTTLPQVLTGRPLNLFNLTRPTAPVNPKP